jgi:mono/diheme cytochrome c family protein
MRHTNLVSAAFVIVAVGAFALQQGGGQSQGQQGGGQQAPGRTSEGVAEANPPGAVPLDNWQPRALPSLPTGVTLALIRQGDSVYRGKGGCNTCHGPDGMGMPNSGSAISLGLNFIPNTPAAIDSLVTVGIPEAVTRSSIAMPGRGLGQNLTPDEVRQVTAYVWAISRVQGEPWPGGHRTHGQAATPTGVHGQVNP